MLDTDWSTIMQIYRLEASHTPSALTQHNIFQKFVIRTEHAD